MIKQVIENDLYKVTIFNVATFESLSSGYIAYGVHAGEKQVIKIETLKQLPQGAQWQEYTINSTKYYSNSAGVLYVDFTDILRTYLQTGRETERMKVEIISSMESENLTDITEIFYFQIWDGINAFDAYLQPANSIFLYPTLPPPSVILRQTELDETYNKQIVVGLDKPKYNVIYVHDYQNEDIYIEAAPYSEVGVLTLPIYNQNLVYDSVAKIIDASGVEFLLREVEPCQQCIMVRWRSAVGAYKQAIWKVKKITNNADSVELQPRFNNYREMRGHDTEFVIFIDGLNRYDYIYYSDIIYSNDIHVSFVANSIATQERDALDDLTSEETQVVVGTNNFTIPDADAGELKTLEINIKYKHYDTI